MLPRAPGTSCMSATPLTRIGLLLCIGLVACGDKPAPPAAAPPPPVAKRAPAPGDSLCPRDALWKECALVDRIVHAGLYFKPAKDTVTVKYLAPKGVRYQVGRYASLLAFYYPDTVALEKQWRTLDTLRLAPPGDTITPWPTLPEVFRSANLVIAIFSTDELQRERVRRAVTAGAPQPPSDPAANPAIFTSPQPMPVQRVR